MKKYEIGLVSVIIPTYHRSKLLKRAIDTVLNQTYTHLELLIVNDNEREDDEYSIALYKLISSYHDKRLTLIKQENHINGAAARNTGIRVARGEFIAFQDDDDYWESTKLEQQVKLLSALNDEYGAVSCLMRIYSNEKLIQSCLPYKSGNVLLDVLTRKTSMGTGALLIRRAALDDSGYFDEKLIRHQDLQLFAHLAEKYKIKLDKIYLHNRDKVDSSNRPSADQIIRIKKDYFTSIHDVLSKLPRKQQKKVYIMHSFECAYLFIRDGKTYVGIKMALGIFRLPSTVYLATERTFKRWIEKKFKYYLERKYSL